MTERKPSKSACQRPESDYAIPMKTALLAHIASVVALLVAVPFLAACGGTPDGTVVADPSASADGLRSGPGRWYAPLCGCYAPDSAGACQFVPDMPQYTCAAFDMSSGPCPEAVWKVSPAVVPERLIVGCCTSRLCAGDFRCKVQTCFYQGDPNLEVDLEGCLSVGATWMNVAKPPVSTVCGNPYFL